MAERRVDAILGELDAEGTQVLNLLNDYRRDEFQPLWRQDPRLYRAFARKLIAEGHPSPALEVASIGLKADNHPHDAELRYLRALALARGGNVGRAEVFIKDMLGTDLPRPLRVEALALLGRLHKQRCVRIPENEPDRWVPLAAASFAAYEEAYRLGEGDTFPGINAATMALLSGKDEASRTLAAEVRARATELLAQAAKRDYWLLATLGEAELLLGDEEAALDRYRQAVRAADRNFGDVASMRSQLLLLRRKLRVRHDLLGLFHLGRCVLFAGHTIDHPGEVAGGLAPFRFPADDRLERAVARAIENELDKLDATIGYCVPSCGAGILFGELMRDRGAELHVILPFALEDFYRTRVDYGLPEMAHWRQRCEKLLERPEAVHYATTEPYLDDQVLFNFADTFLQGLGQARGEQLGVEPVALVVIDPATRALPGGTTAFVKQWQTTGANRKTYEINLADQRKRFGLSAPPPGSAASQAGTAVPPTPRRQVKREVRAMLFADVKDFSKLEEEQAPDFFRTFLQLVKKALVEGTQPLFWNTWGDGLYLVFEGVVPCADFAMRFLESLEKVNWKELGLPEDSGVRIGLHTGPVFKGLDAVLERDNYFGSHVSRAARIEPVTVPGCAFVSEQFAAALAMTPGHGLLCEPLGIHELPKKFGRCPLYHLTRR